jgi:hypothetical protein
MNQRFIPPQPPQLPDAPLFARSSLEAGHVASRFAGIRYRQILAALNLRAACIFEIAQAISVQDHQISGRFGELVKAGLIDRTGIRRPKPGGRILCDEYRLTLFGQGFITQLQLKTPSKELR